jgi:hypothetical protein
VTTRLPPPTRRAVITAGAGLIVPSLAWSQSARRFATGQETPLMQETLPMKVRFAFDGRVFTATLEDNPSARDFASMLPLDLQIDDYSTNEKVAYLPRKLTIHGSGRFGNEAPGDLCYYVPWGNLAFFHAGYRYSSGLIRLGRLDAGTQPLLRRGVFPLRASCIS